MGCFSIFPCFTNSKTQKPVNPPSSLYSDQGNNYLIKFPTQESTNLDSINTPISKSRDDSEDQLINGGDRRKVTTDLEAYSTEDVGSIEDKEGSGKLGDLVQLENEKDRENEKEKRSWKLGSFVQSENEKEREKEECDNVGIGVEVEDENKGNEEWVEENEKRSLGANVEVEKEVKTEERINEVQSQAVSDSSVSSYISYPPMHRYHNCVINEDEEDDDDDEVMIQEESSESLFSLSVDQRRPFKSYPVEADDKEVNSPLKISSSPELITNTISSRSRPNGTDTDHNQSNDYLLNPIENLAQWRTLKAKPVPTLDRHQEKENMGLEQEDISILLSEEPSTKVSDRKGKPKTDTAVTTSLSSWLVEPEKTTTTVSKEESQYSTGNLYTYSDVATSWKSVEDRPILGAWTLDEVRQISARSSPRKSPSRNPDETPIIGTVGSYWTHTGQATDSSNSCTSPMGMSAKSRRNRKIKASSCHSSPAKRRLERAFNGTVA